MKKIFRTLAALTLVVVLAASLSAAAWADGEDADGAETAAAFNMTATVTVTGVAPGEIVNMYRVVDYDANYNSYVYEENFEKYINEQAGADADIDQYFARLTSVQLKSFLDGFVNSNSLPKVAAGGSVGEGASSITFSALAPGYYIITVQTSGNDGNIYLPMSVFARVVGDEIIVSGGGSTGTGDSITLAAKSVKGPTINKEVWCRTHEAWGAQTDASIGDVCSFVVSLTIPAYTDVETLNLVLKDNMTNMEYVTDSAKVYSAEPKNPTNPQAVELLNAIKSDSALTGSSLTFDLDYAALTQSNETPVAKTVYLFYQARVTADAAKNGESVNTAVLSYGRPTTTMQTTTPVQTHVYNYSFTLNKVDADDAPLNGATFEMYTANDAKMRFTQAADGYYFPDANGTVQVLPADNTFKVKGLGHGTYYVKEVSTQRGYFLPKDRFTLTLASFVKADASAQPEHERLSTLGCNFTNPNEANANLVGAKTVTEKNYTVNLRNATTPVLPTTGGAGTVMFTVGGVAVMVLAAVLFLRRKREE